MLGILRRRSERAGPHSAAAVPGGGADAERKWADEQYKLDVGSTSWKITALVGYAGVRVGAAFGVGVHY